MKLTTKQRQLIAIFAALFVLLCGVLFWSVTVPDVPVIQESTTNSSVQVSSAVLSAAEYALQEIKKAQSIVAQPDSYVLVTNWSGKGVFMSQEASIEFYPEKSLYLPLGDQSSCEVSSILVLDTAQALHSGYAEATIAIDQLYYVEGYVNNCSAVGKITTLNGLKEIADLRIYDREKLGFGHLKPGDVYQGFTVGELSDDSPRERRSEIIQFRKPTFVTGHVVPVMHGGFTIMLDEQSLARLKILGSNKTINLQNIEGLVTTGGSVGSNVADVSLVLDNFVLYGTSDRYGVSADVVEVRSLTNVKTVSSAKYIEFSANSEDEVAY